MSYVISTIDLSSATVGSTGSIDWSVIGLQANIGKFDSTARATLSFLNESGFGLQINFTNGQQFYLPAGGWQAVGVAAECTGASYSVLYSLSNPLVTKLLVTWYAPDEAVPAAPILGNSPIGGTVTTSKAQFLDAGVIGGFTEQDFNPSGAGSGPMLISGSPNPSGQTPYLGYWDTTAGAFRRALSWAPAPTASALVNILIALGVTGVTTLTGGLAQLTTYNSETLAGNGLVVNEEDTDNLAVTTTGTKTIASYVVPATASGVATIRASGYVIVNNGVSGNNITFNVNYKDQGGSAISRSLPMFSGAAAVTIMTGAISIANSHYEGYPLTITVQQSQTVTITYNDPTNTPNDHVTGVIERLS